MKQTVATVYSETRYDRFIPDVDNRSVDKINKILVSMKKHGWLNAHPAHVMGNCKPGFFVVIDGQNRIEAAKTLGIPVKYVVDDTPVSAAEISSAVRPWTLRDYLSSFCKRGNKDYIAVAEYVNRTGIRLAQSISMFSGENASSGNVLGQFKDGRFEIKDRDLPERVGAIILHIQDVFPWSRDSLFVGAVSGACCVKAFDPEVFKEKAVKNPTLLRRQPTLDDYKAMLEQVYNRSSKRPIPLKFYIDEEMRKRSFCPGGKKKN